MYGVKSFCFEDLNLKATVAMKLESWDLISNEFFMWI